MPLAQGTRIAHYEIVAPLAERGAGQAWRARDTRMGRDVALKILDGGAQSAAIQQEARLASALNHPAVLTVYDVGEHEGRPYVVSELLEGETLRELLAASMLSNNKALTLALQVAQGLAAAHEKGILHRHLDSGTVFVTRDGRAKILDFGLPAAGASTSLSPEQLRGEPADARSDIFSFGCALHEMLGRRPAFAGTDDVLRADPAPIAPRPPRQVADLLSRCLQKRAEDRFRSAQELVAKLVQMLMGEHTGEQAPLSLPAGQTPGSYARLQALSEVLGRPVGAATARVALRDLAPGAQDVKRAKPQAPPPPKPRGRGLWLAAIAVLLAIAAVVFLSRRGG